MNFKPMGKTLAYAVRNVTVTKRNTLLKERLEIEK